MRGHDCTWVRTHYHEEFEVSLAWFHLTVCNRSIADRGKSGYKRSEDVGAKQFDGSYEGKQSTGRTSENAWCSNREGCRDEEVPARLHNRIASVLGIPADNSEDFQMLRYEVGQFYKTHHVSFLLRVFSAKVALLN